MAIVMVRVYFDTVNSAMVPISAPLAAFILNERQHGSLPEVVERNRVAIQFKKGRHDMFLIVDEGIQVMWSPMTRSLENLLSPHTTCAKSEPAKVAHMFNRQVSVAESTIDEKWRVHNTIHEGKNCEDLSMRRLSIMIV